MLYLDFNCRWWSGRIKIELSILPKGVGKAVFISCDRECCLELSKCDFALYLRRVESKAACHIFITNIFFFCWSIQFSLEKGKKLPLQ